MKLNIVSWNSTTDINNGTDYSAWYESKQQFVPTRTPIYADRAEKWKKLSGAQFDDHSFTLKVRCLGTIHTQRETVKGWFSPEDFTPRTLVFEDTADSNKQWYIEGLAKKIYEESPGIMAVTIATDEPFLRTVADSTGTLTVTASGDSTSFSVSGNLNARPIIKITPTAAKNGDFGYSRWVPVYNPGNKQFSNYSVDFGGINTAALVGAGKMQATGIDYLLEIDGNTVDKWFGTTDGRGINTTDTALWGNIDLAPKIELPLKDAIGLSDSITRVDFVVGNTAQSNAFVRAMSLANKVMLIGNEAFTYTRLNIDRTGAYATGVSREEKGTSAAAHSANATIRFLEHDIWQVYGSSDYSATSTDYYTVDDDNKPMFDLHSTNTNKIFSQFRQYGKARPMQWIPQIVFAGTGENSRAYTGYHTANSNPAEYAGMKIEAYRAVNWRGDTANIIWKYSDPAGITHVQASGEKFIRNYTNTVWPDIAGLQYLDPDLGLWTTADNQSVPTTSAAWQAFTIASTGTGDLGVAAYSLRFAFIGSVYGAANNYNAMEFSGATLTASSTGCPQVTVNAEQSKYLLNCRIVNSTTGEWIRLRAVVSLNKTITIDCNAKTVTYADGTNLFAGLALSSSRSEWLDMTPGANTLRYYENGAEGVTVGVEWENRNTL